MQIQISVKALSQTATNSGDVYGRQIVATKLKILLPFEARPLPHAPMRAMRLSVDCTVVGTHMIFGFANKFDVISRLQQIYRRGVTRDKFVAERQSLAINLSLAACLPRLYSRLQLFVGDKFVARDIASD